MSFAWAKQYEPKTALTKWLDEKLPLPRLVYNAVGAGYPVPRNLNYMWNFGVLAGFFLVVQIITGILLGPSLFGWIAPELFDLVFRSAPSEPMLKQLRELNLRVVPKE